MFFCAVCDTFAGVTDSKQNARDRRGGKPGTRDEAQNRKKPEHNPADSKKAGKPDNPDVGDLKRDR